MKKAAVLLLSLSLCGGAFAAQIADVSVSTQCVSYGTFSCWSDAPRKAQASEAKPKGWLPWIEAAIVMLAVGLIVYHNTSD